MSSSQDRIFLSPPHVSERERELLLEAFDSNYIAPVGPALDAFEESFREQTGFAHCVAVTSGTAALHLALVHLGIQSGDTVIASTLTFIGSVGPAFHLGAKLIFVDSSEDTWNMDPALLRQALEECKSEGSLPKVILPTDIYGQSCDLDVILEIGEEYGIPVVVDSAESLGATYRGRSVGKGAAAAAFSFNGNKIITTSGGGMLASDDEKIIDHARHLSTQAREPVSHFEHREVGFNFRLSNLCAAVGKAQMEALPSRVKRKREIFAYYRDALAGIDGIEMMPEAAFGESNAWLSVITIDPETFGSSNEEIRMRLEEDNIESRPTWKPMHCQPALSGAIVIGGSISERLFETGLCLPSGTALRDSDLDRICEIICSMGR
jgi:dTDP-4-amino-4,6-dideoxygalactose transaminase